MKILVVDDNPKHLAAADDLVAAGHEVVRTDEYEKAIKLLNEDAQFNAILADRSMPAEPYALGSTGLKYLGHPIDIGYVLLIRAAQVGIRYGAILTDASHHDDPGSAAIDWIYRDMPITINSMKAFIIHAPIKDGRKDWLAVFNQLLAS